MSGLEIVAIVACVAGLVSAFNDGNKILAKIKKRRADRKAPPPTFLLEQSLQRAPQDIEREREMGIERCGEAFKVGDGAYKLPLSVAYAEAIRDATEVSIIALQGIHINLQKTLLNQLLAALDDDQMTDFSTLVDASDSARDHTVVTLIQLRSRLYQSVPTAGLAPTPHPFSAPNSVSTVAPSERLKGKRHSSSSSLLHILEGMGEDTAAVWEGELSQKISTRRRSSVMSVSQTRPIQGSYPLPDPGYGNTPLSPSPSPSTLARPTAENNYLGFCKGAWKTQDYDAKAMQKVSDYQSFSGGAYYMVCSSRKCAFADHLDPNKLRQSLPHGVKYRLAFLSRSHIPQAKVKKGRYDFQCMFCVFRGLTSPPLQGVNSLLDHLVSHRGEVLGDVLLDRTRCISGYVAEDCDSFDINLFPIEDSRDDRLIPTAGVWTVQQGALGS